MKNKNNPLYVLKFRPILKKKLWGGTKLNDILHKKTNTKSIGESWEISAVKDNYSLVTEGSLAGKSLQELLSTYRESLIGGKNYMRFGDNFPLLIKFIDAKEDLSVQLHPDDQIARTKHNSFGKTEMWYVLQTDSKSRLIIGFDKEINYTQYQKHITEGTLINILNTVEVAPGDAFYIKPGLVHAIGKGTLLVEIQQTSDITYRIYDWDRKDKDGNPRELHQEKAMEAIDFSNNEINKLKYTKTPNKINNLINCDFFITNIIIIDKEITVSHDKLDSFVIYICIEGKAIVYQNKDIITLRLGETILVPANIKNIRVYSDGAKLLQTYV